MGYRGVSRETLPQWGRGVRPKQFKLGIHHVEKPVDIAVDNYGDNLPIQVQH